ncbi:response regulator [bacterium]|nr:response regulator [bacterium]
MAKDPYKYFRIEAREIVLGLTQGVLELEKGAASKELVGRLLRLAHTLKGAARVVKQAPIAELAHSIEDVLAPHREGGGVLAADRTSELLRLIDAASEKLTTLEQLQAPGEEPRARRAAGDDPAGAERNVSEPLHETVRVEIGELDALLLGLSEASVKASALRQQVPVLERVKRAAAALSLSLESRRESRGDPPSSPAARGHMHELRTSLEHLSRDFSASVERTERELEQARETANRLRLVPASEVLASLERTVRDAARSLGKRVDFEATGGECRLDAHVLATLGDALPHVVRNAVVHGIEPEAERIAAGKPPAGRVQLLVTRRGGRATFTCRDDGRGIDVDAIRRVAVRRGLISPAEAASLELEQAVSLLLRGGVSTARALTEMAGRGVGLDIVREVVSRLKGAVDIRSERGRGTTIEIGVPISLSSMTALLVEANGLTASIPLDGVVQTVRLAEAEVVRSGDGDSIALGGTVIPFLTLVALVGGKASPGSARPRACSAVVVRSGPSRAAIGVDRLCGTARVVVRTLPPVVGPVPALAGAAFDPEGNPVIVLDPAGVVEIARTRRRAESEAAPPRRPPVLVIDDSLTTRMLEQSILESAGYEVELASSAEEGLDRARSRRFGVFIVDVEMAGMDGYDFVALTRKDPVLGQVPAILVTSRASAEDRRRGAEVGAYAYIAKGEFDQGRLLQAMAELIG